jgi:hypothetical protein
MECWLQFNQTSCDITGTAPPQTFSPFCINFRQNTSDLEFPAEKPIRPITPYGNHSCGHTYKNTGTLPEGLFFSNLNGTIYGTPSVAAVRPAPYQYEVVAYHKHDMRPLSNFKVAMKVTGKAPQCEYLVPEYTLRKGALINGTTYFKAVIYNADPNAKITSAQIVSGGKLPAGLEFNNNTGQVTGIPMIGKGCQNASTYWVEASNSCGSTTCKFVVPAIHSGVDCDA